jgi:hypothetical protein
MSGFANLMPQASTSTPTSTPTPPSSSTTVTTNRPTETSGTPTIGYRLPDNTTLQNAVKWGIIEDKPIMMDYWANSLNKEVLIGVKENGEKLLVKSVDEYTSPVSKILKHNTDFIIMTENSIYLVDSGIPVKRIS